MLRPEMRLPGPPNRHGLEKLDEYTWERMALGLYFLATTGYSVRREVAALVGSNLAVSNPTSGTVWRIFAGLQDKGLIESALAPLVRSSRLSLVRLTEKGEMLCRDLGWEPCESDWALLDCNRGADLGYVGITLEFAFLARQRDWIVELLPECGSDADVLVQKLDKQHHVHMLGQHFRPLQAQWRLMANDDNRVAIITTLPSRRIRLAQAARSAGVPGIAADLQTLILNGKKQKGEQGLWLQSWD